MTFRLAEARRDGHSDADIAAYLARRHGFNLDRARADGVSDAEVADYLAARPFPATQPPSTRPPASTQPVAAPAVEMSLRQRMQAETNENLAASGVPEGPDSPDEQNRAILAYQKREREAAVRGELVPRQSEVPADGYFPDNQSRAPGAVDRPVAERRIRERNLAAGRTTGEVISDAAGAVGAGMQQIPASFVGLFAPDSETAERMQRAAQAADGNLSPFLQARLEEARERIQAAAQDGLWDEVKAASDEYLTDPTLFSYFALRTMPSMLGVLGPAKLAQAAAAMRGASAAQIAKVTAGAAGAANAGMTGGDARQQAYDTIYQALREQGVPDEEARARALEESRLSAGVGAGLGWLGGKYGAEAGMLGLGTGRTAAGRAAGVIAGETGTELAEELAPQLLTNSLASRIDGRNPLEGLGETAVQTVAGAGPMATVGAVGAARRPGPQIEQHLAHREAQAAATGDALEIAVVQAENTAARAAIAPRFDPSSVATAIEAQGVEATERLTAGLTPEQKRAVARHLLGLPPETATAAPDTASPSDEAATIDQAALLQRAHATAGTPTPEQEEATPASASPQDLQFTAGAGFGPQPAIAPLEQTRADLPLPQSTSTATAPEQPVPLLMSNGRPFPSEKLAATSARQRKLDMRAVPVEGGWGLVPIEQAPSTASGAPQPAPAPDEAPAGQPDTRYQVVLPNGRIFGSYTARRDAEGALKRAGAGATLRPTPEAAPDTPAAWQQTADEFIDSDIVRRATTNRADLARQHFDAVRAAVERGEPVPDRVLANYSSIVRPDLNDDQRDLMLDQVRGSTPEEIVAGWRAWGGSAQGTPTSPSSAKATPDLKAARPLDHGELNIPGRTSGIDAELDRWKADQAKAKRAQTKADAVAHKAKKAEARQLFAQFGPAMVERYAPRFGRKEIEHELDQMVKWQPAKFIDLVQRFQREQAAATQPTSTAAPEAAPAQASKMDNEQETDSPLLQANGRPFKNARLAATSARQRGFDMRPVRVEGGWGLVPTAQAPLPKPWALSPDDFLAFVQIEREGKGWAARWDGEVLKSEPQVVNGNLGRTVVQGARIFQTRKEAEAVARLAHRKAVEAAVTRGEQVAPEALAQYPELSTPAGAAPATRPAPQPETETPRAKPTAPTLTPGQTAKGRDVILAQVEALKQRTAPADLVADYNQLKDRIADARRRASLKGTKRNEAARLTEWADNQEPELERLRNAIGFVELKAGSTRYRILNTPQNLEAFAQKLKKAPVGRWTVTVKPEEIYDNVETRAGTTEAQRTRGRSAIAALVDRVNARSVRDGRGSATLLGHRLLESFAGTGGADLVGQTVSSAEDLATLAQVFRDPRFETFRVFYTDAQGAIVGEAAYSSRLPAAVRLPTDLEARIGADMERFGGSGFWVLHNHPSGRATPSRSDVNLTLAVAQNVAGFQGHVVIDHNEYATIDAAGEVSVIKAPQLNGADFFNNPERDHALLGTPLIGEQDVVKAAKALQVPDGHAALILTRRDGAVQLLMDVPLAMLQVGSSKDLGKLKGALRGFARESGSGGHRFIVLPAGVSPQPFTKLVTTGLFTDVVSADGTTAGNFGAFWTGDFLDANMPVRQVKEDEGRTLEDPPSPYQTSQPQPNSSAPAAPPAETRARALQRRTQDKFNRFTVIQDWLKARGINLTEQANVYRAEERMHGRAATRIEDFREKRLKPVVEKIRKAGFDMAEVADFLHAQHAEERNAQIAKINSEMPDGGAGMTNAEAQAKLAQYQAQPELVVLANELRVITDDTKRVLLEAGIITQEMADAWGATYQHYVPLKGGPDEDSANQGTGRGLTVKQKNKRALGHGTREEWIIENILRDHERAILQAEKNRVGQHLLMLAIEAGHEDLITIGQPVKRQVLKDTVHYEVRYHGSTVEVFRSLADAQRFVGIEALKPGRSKKDFAIQASHDLDVVMMPSPVLEPNETQVYVAGHAVRVQFKDEGLARAWNNLGAESFNVVMRLAREVNTFLARAYTGWNPEFILVNVFRDLGTGVLNLTGEEGGRFALTALKNYPRAFAELLKYAHTGNPSNWIRQYRADGGTTGAAYLSDLERIGKDVQAAYDEAAGVIQTWRNGGSYRAARAAVREILGPFVRWIEKLNQAGENAMRLAAYRTAVEMGQSRARAAALAKNSTVNFNRQGELGQTIGSLYLFANPAIQGTASIVHALFKGKHKAQAHALTGAIVAAGYTMAALNGGGPEDEYEKLPEFQKERFMPIWTGDGWVKIPIPYGYGFFATMGRQVAALEKGEDPAKVSLRLAASFVEEFSVWGAAADPEGDEKNVTFLLPTIPQIVMAPIINRTGLGAPVYPESPFDQSKPDNLKMWRTTQGTVFHDAAKGLNAVTGGDAVQKGWIDVSPETLRYLWTTATGGTGRFFTDSVALAKNVALEGLEPDDVESREVPIVRKFVSPANDIRGARARFWKAAEEVREAEEAFARAKKLEDLAERNDLTRQIAAESGELLALGRALGSWKRAIRAERDMIDAILADESRTLTERRAMVKEIEIRERELYDGFVAQFKQVTKAER